MKSLIVLTLLAATAHASDLSTWQERDQTYKHDLAIGIAEGKETAATLRAEGQAIRADRIAKLGASKVVTDQQVRQERRAQKVASAEAEAAGLIASIARDEKEIAAAPSEAAYARIFAAREEIAEAGLRKAEANWELEQFQYDALSALVEKEALSAEVLPEARKDLAAKVAEVSAAQKLVELAKAALPARRGSR